jgi:hypothetical protein
MVKFVCNKCGHKLKASPDRAGQRCKCSRCGHVLTVPALGSGSSPDGSKHVVPNVGSPPAPTVSEPLGPVTKKARWRLVLVAGLLAAVGLVVFRLYPSDVERNLNDLKGGTSEARRQALVWLAEADIDGSRRALVITALEPMVFEGDVRKELSTDLLLRAYLHWAGPDDVPAMIRVVQSSTLPAWSAKKAGLVMEALGRLQDPRAAEVLAEKLPDPALHDQAVAALRHMGPKAQDAVLVHVFDDSPDARLGATQLLAEYGAKPQTIAGEALGRLKSKSPAAQLSAARWFAQNPPDDERQQSEVARALAGLLEDLSPQVDVTALDALKLWATRDSIPQLVAFARREESTAACPAELIDVLARFPDESAAKAIALQLQVTANRGRAVQALLKFGPAATKEVLQYINDPDPAVQKEARGLCQQLNVPAPLQLDQTLADVADGRKPRSRAALQWLAQLRPDEANRARVSQALNTALLDPDPAVLEDALNAARVWGSQANTATLLKLFATLRTGGAACDSRVIELLGSLKDPAAAPALAEGLTRQQELAPAVNALVAMGPRAEEAVIPYLLSSIREARFAACWALGEIGTSKSLSPLAAAASHWSADPEFFERTQIASEKITARM